MDQEIKRKIQLISAAIKCASGAIDTALKMDDSSIAIEHLEARIIEARELLRYALAVK